MTKRVVLSGVFLLSLAFAHTAVASAAGTPLPGGYLEHVRYHVNVLNDSDKCVWFTPYWSTPAGSFSIMSGGPRVIEAHRRSLIDYTTPIVVHTNVQMEIRVRAEFFTNACSGGKAADKSHDSYGTPWGDDNDLPVSVTIAGPEDGYGIYIGSIGHKH